MTTRVVVGTPGITTVISIAEQGVPGAQGIQGIQGEIGPAGLTGDTGAQGIQGEIGPTGLTGAQGINGTAGTATLDFGLSSKTAQVIITGVDTILATSTILLSMRNIATVSHSVDDMLVDPIRLAAHSIVQGVGFTLYGEMGNASANGTYGVAWLLQ
jgi:hypothetical protein